MNTNNKEAPVSNAIAEGLLKLKKEPEKKETSKEGVDLLEITKKLSAKKFGKRR